MREKLIAAGVRNLKEFGYPSVTPENILTDAIYSVFFTRMLEDNKGRGVDAHIDLLLAEIKAAQPAPKPEKKKRAATKSRRR